ncbi:neprilysin-1-like [Haemaphysalis longicornis]
MILLLDAVYTPGDKTKRGVLMNEITVVHLASFLAWIGFVCSMPSMTATPKDSYDICTSSVCLQKAKDINESLDPCFDPCNDFYMYACGGWIKKHPIPESKSWYGTFNELRDDLTATLRDILGNLSLNYGEHQNVTDKVAAMYNACSALDDKENETTDIKAIMKKHGFDKWPITCESGCNESSSNWSDVLLKAGIHHVLKLHVDKDSRRNFSYILQMNQISFSTVGRNQLIQPHKEENRDIITAYKKLIKAAIQFFKPNITEDQATRLADTIVEFEGELANLTAPPEERRDILALYHRLKVQELQANYSHFPLLELLNREFTMINMTLNESEVLEMYALQYYHKLVPFLQQANSTTFFNYVGANAMLYWGQYASRNIRNASFDLLRAKTGVTKDIPRWEKCVKLATTGMQDVIGNLYVKNKFSKEAKEEVEDLVRRLKQVFSETIKNATWMDNETKSEAETKLEKMKSKIGYPEWILNTTYLEQLYKHVPRLNKTSSFLSIWEGITENNWKREMEKLRANYDPEADWVVGPAVVNAFYNPTSNEMVFPSGILQRPFYQRGLPRSINFGAIGMVVGHELTHGFDDEGSQYDAYGGLRQWWSNSTRKKFEEKAGCFVTQYGSICDEEANMMLNGNNTVGENIADNGGLRTAFLAYKKLLNEDCEGKDTRLQGLEDLSGEKLFFIANGQGWCSSIRRQMLRDAIQYDPHSPPKYRVNLPMMNMPEFAAVFNCSAGSPMNPNRSQTCSLW